MPDIAQYPIRYWLWLSLAIPAGSSAAEKLLSAFDNDPKRIYEATEEEYAPLELSATTLKALLDKSLRKAEEIYNHCKQNGVFLLAPGLPGYPDRLCRISRMPLVLYCKGKLPDLDREATVAMVGTRRMTAYGKRMAYEIAYDLARAGAIVISGLALGVDAVAHRGCLDAGGFTVAVLGCGIDVTYPKENFELFEEIERKGLIVTEYPPGTRPFGSNFPTRNRIISGLSLGTVVIEADSKSGALITADYARKQGRDLFALPGMVGELNSEGTNHLIQTGALPVTDARDILSEYELLYPTKLHSRDIPVYRPIIRTDTSLPQSPKRKGVLKVAQAQHPEAVPEPSTAAPYCEPEQPIKETVIPKDLNGAHSEVYLCISELGEPTQDEIIAKTGLSASNAMVILTVLEIKGYITSLPGGRYTVQN